MPEERKVRFGIIGCGAAAVPVCEAIAVSPLTELAMTHDINTALARELAERFQVPYVETSEQLLSSSDVEAVYIAVPHHLLALLAQQALRAGKHVLVEKPMAISLAETDKLIALAEERKQALDVFYEMRHIVPYAQAREIVQSGAIGEIIGVRIQTLIDKRPDYWQVGYAGRSNNPWRGKKDQAGGGVVLMNTSHALDALRFITGLQVMSVSAEIGTLVAKVEVEDTAVATLRFNNGALGSLCAGAHIPGAQRAECFDLYGTRGQLRLPDPYGGDSLRVYVKHEWNGLAADQWHVLPHTPTPVYVRAIEAFAQIVGNDPPTTTGARDARQTLATVLALYQAAAEHQTIQVSNREVHYA
ncbi:MAG: Gfo/Idh/MocA family protein [Anaerolineales bacterium]